MVAVDRIRIATTLPRRPRHSILMPGCEDRSMPMRLVAKNRLNDRPWHGCALAQNADQSNGRRRLDNFVAMRQMVMENGDRGAPSARRPVGHLQRGVLLIL